MDELIDQLRDVAWIRWRLRDLKKAVTLLGVAGTPVAHALVGRSDASPSGERRGWLERAARLWLRGATDEGSDWSVRSDADELLLRVQRTARPRGLSGLLDGEHLVTAPTEIGRIGRAAGMDRPVTTPDGRQLVWTVTDRHLGLAARLIAPGGDVVLEVVPPRLAADRVPVPTDGLLGPHDSGVVVPSTAPSDLVALGLALALLELQECASGDRPSGRRGATGWRAPKGVGRRAASRAEHDRAVDSDDERRAAPHRRPNAGRRARGSGRGPRGATRRTAPAPRPLMQRRGEEPVVQPEEHST